MTGDPVPKKSRSFSKNANGKTLTRLNPLRRKRFNTSAMGSSPISRTIKKTLDNPSFSSIIKGFSFVCR